MNNNNHVYGDSFACPSCKEMSYPPFYACKHSCLLNTTEKEKEEAHAKFQSEPITCQEIKALEHCKDILLMQASLGPHLREDHGIKRVKFHKNKDQTGNGNKHGHLGGFQICLPVSEFVEESKEQRWQSVSFTSCGVEFILCSVLGVPNSHFWVVVDDEDNVGRRFKYTVSIVSDSLSPIAKKKCEISRTVHSWHYYDFNKIRSRRETAPFPWDFLARTAQDKANHKALTIEINLFKRPRST